MIDMMVILVFFLIFTAVFSKTTILELNLPGSNASVPDLPEGLQLEVIVRERPDRRGRPHDRHRCKSLPNTAGGLRPAGLSDYLRLVKAQVPGQARRTSCSSRTSPTTRWCR